MQVLHTRSCSGTGMSFVRFLTACYLTFNMDMLTVAKALEALPALPLLTAAQGTGSNNAHSLTTWCLSRACAAAVSLLWSLFSVRPKSSTLVSVSAKTAAASDRPVQLAV